MSDRCKFGDKLGGERRIGRRCSELVWSSRRGAAVDELDWALDQAGTDHPTSRSSFSPRTLLLLVTTRSTLHSQSGIKNMGDSTGQNVYASTLFQSRQVYVYRIPPRSSVVGGYKANDWADPKTGDLASTAIWKGRLRVVEYHVSSDESESALRESKCEIRLEDAETGELFAMCPYTVQTASEVVEPVTDSSRYYVIRPESGGRKAFIGMGFEDRDQSFDFNVSLSGWVKQQQRATSTQSGGAASGLDGLSVADGPSPHLPKEGAKDFSLKDGQTFSVKIPGAGGRKIRETSTKSSSGAGLGGGFGGGPLLPPPPSRRG